MRPRLTSGESRPCSTGERPSCDQAGAGFGRRPISLEDPSRMPDDLVNSCRSLAAAPTAMVIVRADRTGAPSAGVTKALAGLANGGRARGRGGCGSPRHPAEGVEGHGRIGGGYEHVALLADVGVRNRGGCHRLNNRGVASTRDVKALQHGAASRGWTDEAARQDGVAAGLERHPWAASTPVVIHRPE